jgi:hypothetical protein
MIVSEPYKEKYIKHYSDRGYKIIQVETGRVFCSAIDLTPCRFTYEETDIILDNYSEEHQKAHAYDILMGVIE